VTSPVLPGPIDQGNGDDGADRLSRLVAGNDNLTTHPELVSALLSGQASPQQAQVVDLFVGGLRAQGRVTAAQATGTKIYLSDREKAGLDALNVDYSGSEWNHAHLVKAITGGDGVPLPAPATTIGGTLNKSATTVSAGNVDNGWFDSFGGFADHLMHNPVTDAIGKAQNFSESLVTTANAVDTGNLGNEVASKAQAATAAGYDPSSALSLLAFTSSGHDTLDITDLNDKYGSDKVDEALQYINDPNKFLTGVVTDEALTPEQRGQKLAYIQQSDEFKGLVEQVASRNATVGNVFATGLHIDPVKHPDLYHWTSTGTDVAFWFAADPTLLALKGVQAVKATKLALDGVGDMEKVRALLDGTTKGVYAGRARQGMQSLLDNTAAIRKGMAEGDDAAVAAGYARIRTETPGLEHLAGDFLGNRAVELLDPKLGQGAYRLTAGEPITTMEQAADYLSGHVGLVRLRAGRPLVEGTFMPGQLSSFGFRKLRATMAAGLAARGVRGSKYTIDLTHDASRVLPTVTDAVDDTGKVLAGDTQAAGDALASHARAAGDDLLAQRSGFGPTALVARAKLAAQRFTSYLPRSTKFATNDPNAAEAVFRYGNMYLTRSHANLLAGMYAAGDEGTRKAILQGLQLQTMHAAGLGTTEAGRAFIDAHTSALSEGRYASAFGDLDLSVDPLTGEPMRSAVWDTQVNPVMTLPSFTELQKQAAKVGLFERTAGRMFNSQLVDNLMQTIKGGWLMTGTNSVRNSGEDLVNAWTRGELGDVMRAKHLAQVADVLPKRTRLGTMIAAPLARLGQLYRAGLRQLADPEQRIADAYVGDLVSHTDYGQQFAENWQRLHGGSMVDPAGVQEADAITRAGYVPHRMRMTKRAGFRPELVEGQRGADIWAQALGRIVDQNPDHARSVLAHIEDSAAHPIDNVVDSLLDPKRAELTNRMTLLGRYLDDNGVWRQAITADEKKLAARQVAEKQATDLQYLLVGKGGTVLQDLADHIRVEGKAPSSTWLMDRYLKAGGDVPAQIMAPYMESVPVENGITGLAGVLADLSGKGYQWMVERPIARMSSLPVYLSNYGKTRVGLRAVEKALVEGGLDPEVANRIVMQHALEGAFHRTVTMIDDPTLRLQMDVVGRNFFAFSRATTAFIRRWSRTFLENPARLRKTMLALEGSQHAGITYTDENGNKQFMYPGSGFAIDALQHLQNLLPGADVYTVPGMTPNLTGQVALLQPGLQNPLQFSLTPMVNIPMRTIFNMFPQHKQGLDEVDSFLNGHQGQGQSPLAEILPTSVKKFTDALNSDDRDSMMASAARQAILNLAAAGQVPASTADAAQRDEFLQRLRVQTKNALMFRAVFGFFTPSPPGTPTDETSGSQADWMFRAMGVHGLDAEFKTILNESGNDWQTAAGVWAGLHPDKLFYTVGTTKSTTKSAVVGATTTALSWMQDHLGFMHDYKEISSYFVPVATQTGDFDLNAYHAELELGLRQHKDLSEFYTDVRTVNAEQQFFDAIASATRRSRRTRRTSRRTTPGSPTGTSMNCCRTTRCWVRRFRRSAPRR
jgi:hypothetical protein